jgi:vancomycin permeability regulator SanA
MKKVARNRFPRPLRTVIVSLLVLLLAVLLGIFAVDGRVTRLGGAHLVSLDEAPASECVIVLGAAVFPNGQPSQMLRDRLDVALQLYQSGKTDRILVSGDNGSVDYNEVRVMKNYLVAQGVPEAHVFMDHAGFDTYSTMYRARDVFLVRKALVVTQEFHLLRALYIGDRLGLEVAGVASDPRVYDRADYYRLREYLARVKAFIECEITRPLPRFLGDPIPLHDGPQSD